jgi:hypothetical protein
MVDGEVRRFGSSTSPFQENRIASTLPSFRHGKTGGALLLHRCGTEKSDPFVFFNFPAPESWTASIFLSAWAGKARGLLLFRLHVGIKVASLMAA